ncbi:hypothetical protein AGMMS50276_30850 [Synergistales bacterium]|nr:hypothetical protein AGMMS50276_30850 [Synergistales bacterium]
MYDAIIKKLTELRLKAIPVVRDIFDIMPSSNAEFMFYSLDCLIECITKKPSRYAYDAALERLRKKYGSEFIEAIDNFAAEIKDMNETCKETGMYMFKDAMLPYLSPYENPALPPVLKDTFLVYMEYDDCYDESKIDVLFDALPEGPYGLRNGAVDVTVKPGDVVIDAGSWIGDFAAYASAKGATVYAFEPDDTNYEFLLSTADFNQDIHPVKKGLGDKKAKIKFESTGYGSSDSKIVSRERERDAV